MKTLPKFKSAAEKAWLVHGAVFDGDEEIPLISTADEIPPSLVRFSDCATSNDYSSWVHFYEPDEKFTKLWNNPKGHVAQLQKFGGIIAPDFSICPDYPINVQRINKYQNHALAYWLSTQKIPVIPNVRWGDERSYSFCFSGIERNRVVAVGTHGQMKSTANRELFLKGLPVMVSTLSPHTIIVYGTAPDDIWGEYKKGGINIIQFSSQKACYHNQRKAVA